MCYKVSNTAQRQVIEHTFDATFKFPKLHVKTPVINGLNESLVSIITLSNPEEVSFAIWGMLPETYKEDWQHYQNVQNTLNLRKEDLQTDLWFSKQASSKRCLVIVTGFFTYYLHQGEVYPYYVHLENEEPFALAGIYSQLEDGFLTCSLLMTETDQYINQINNMGDSMPIVLTDEERKAWLNQKGDAIAHINNINTSTSKLDFKAYPIAKEFHKIDVDYDAVLEPVNYESIPQMHRF